MPETLEIPIDKIMDPPAPMRFSFDEGLLEELSNDILRRGLLQPVIVYREKIAGVEAVDSASGQRVQGEPRETGFFIVSDGHRRLIACRMAGLKAVRCEVHDEPNFDSDAAMVAANLHRAAVSPLEEGNIFCKWAFDDKLTESQMRARTGKSLHYIEERIKLCQGDPAISEAVHEGKVKLGCAKFLNQCTDEPHRRYLLKLCIDMDATSTQVADWIRQWKVEQGLRPPMSDKQLPPTPAQVPFETPVRCAFCGQSERPHDLANIYVCHAELRAILVSLKAAEGN
jgi:ParB family chromosome partitioning protein